jgi:hypothetical protein
MAELAAIIFTRRRLSLGVAPSYPSNSSSFHGSRLCLGVATGFVTFGIFVSLQLHKNKPFNNNTSSFIKTHCSEAYLVLLLNFLHTVWQTTVSPPVPHTLFHYPDSVIQHVV